MKKMIIGLLIISLIILSACSTSPFAGAERVKAFESKCKEKNMTYFNEWSFVPNSVYDCKDSSGEVHTFIMKW